MTSKDAAQVFKILGDENRLRIVMLIAKQEEICACNLLDTLNIAQPTLSHHMKLPSSCGLVKSRKDGRWMHYSLNHDLFKHLESFLGELA